MIIIVRQCVSFPSFRLILSRLPEIFVHTHTVQLVLCPLRVKPFKNVTLRWIVETLKM
jgi:hypothetical protein